MQQRPESRNLVLIAAIIGGGLLLIFFLLNRGSGGGGLVGPTWQLAAITGQAPAFQGVIPAEDQGRYTITFGDDGTFAARADCNPMAGTYEQKGQDGLTIVPGPSTLVACQDGSYGSLFAHALSKVTTWAIEGGQLTLTTSDGGTGTFVAGPAGGAAPTATPTESPTPTPTPSPTPTPTPTPSPTPAPTAAPTSSSSAETSPTPAPTTEPTPAPTPTPAPKPSPTPSPGADLIGTSWQLATITTRDPVHQGVVPEAERAKYTVAFAADGTFTATADCNTVNGTWTATAEGGLMLSPGPSTIVACGEGSLGDLYVLALTDSASYAIADGALTITLSDGGTLGFEATPSS
jgi:heat shock protein HslJ